jgi:eukaryotic-like serine/threonine-protein kinase
MESETAVVNERYQVAVDRVRVTTLTEDLPASDLLLNRDVVFRALKPELTTDRTFVDRFRKQVQKAANLTHPNIVAVYDWGRERDGFGNRPGPVYFVITERNTGRSVWSYVNEKGPLPIERVIHILLGVTSAVGYAHRNGTLHAGLRPELISVSPSGLVKVSDFGFLEAVGSMANLAQTTVSDVQWLAPELGGDQTPDERTDVYGVGELCYFLTTARIPFSGNSVEEVLRKQQTSVPPAPRKIRPEIPRALEVIIGRCLAKQPTDRFSNVNELRAALVRLQDSLGGPVTGSPTIAASTDNNVVPLETKSRPVAVADLGAPVGPDEPTQIDIPVNRLPEQSSMVVIPSTTTTEMATTETATTSPSSPPLPPVTPAPAATPATPATAQTSGRSWGSPAVRPPTFAEDLDGASDPDATRLATRTSASASTATTATTATTTSSTSGISLPGRDGPTPSSGDDPSSELNDSTLISSTRKSPSIKGWLALLAMLVVLIGLLGLLAQSLKSSRAETVLVPSVISKSADVATTELSGLGLRVETKYEANPDVSRDVVFAQDPGANVEVPSGSLITLKVSSGDGILRVPDVIGQSEAVATSTLRKGGFSVKVEARADENTAPGNVLEQRPRAETEAKAGDSVTIVIASRSGIGKVPDVTGRSPEEAEQALTAEGFRTVKRDEANATVDAGLVSRTDPVAGRDLDRNGTVIVFISRGPAVEVPTVVGQPEAAAISTLKGLGFVVDRQTKLVATQEEVGKVIEQTPKGASKAVSGSTVSIIVGELDPNAPTTIPAQEGGQATIVTTTTTIAPPPPTEAPTTIPAPTVPTATLPPEATVAPPASVPDPASTTVLIPLPVQ